MSLKSQKNCKINKKFRNITFFYFFILVILSFSEVNYIDFSNNNIKYHQPSSQGNWIEPAILGTFSNPIDSNEIYIDNIRDIFISNGIAYILDDTFHLILVNISNPTTPNYLSYYNEVYARKVYVANDIAFISSDNGLTILNVSIPTNPLKIGEYTGFDGNGLFYKDNLVYIGHRYNGMKILNVTDPTNPILLGSYLNGPNQTYDDIYVFDDLVYVADYQGGNIKIIDVSDPNNPQILCINNSVDTVNGGPNSVFATEDLLYLTNYEGGFHIMNTSNPTSITEIGAYNPQGRTSGVFINGQTAYLSDYDKNLLVLNISIMEQPVLINSMGDNDCSYDVFYANGLIYLGNGNNGLIIIDPGYDNDEDGLPDKWEEFNGFNPNDEIDAIEDWDSDDLSNLLEFQLKTNITNGDSDNDGLFDGEEYYETLTDPTNPDSDNDGILDGVDILPLDTDNDGITNLDEINIYLTDPTNPDSDDDELSDGVEILVDLDPNNWDTDGDGIGDGLEFIANFGSESTAQALPDGFLRMTIQWNEGFATITTNSTMVSSSFDQEKKQLDFKIKGPDNTFALCNISIPSNIIDNLENMKIMMDGNLINATIIEESNIVLIQFIYTHSEHDISILLNDTGSNQISGYNNIMILFFFSIVLIRNKKQRKFI